MEIEIKIYTISEGKDFIISTGEWRGQELVEMWGFRILGWEGMRILSQRNRHRVEKVLQQVRLESFEWRYENCHLLFCRLSFHALFALTIVL